MKKLILLFVIVLGIGAGLGFGQKVEVDQTFVDDATKAFLLVPELKKSLESCLTERKFSDAERDSVKVLIKGFDDLIKVKDQISAEKDKIIALYEKVIEFQSQIIDKLEKKLLKPKSFFQKFLQAVKETLLILGGIALGRGL